MKCDKCNKRQVILYSFGRNNYCLKCLREEQKKHEARKINGRQVISGGALYSDIKRVIDNDSLTDKEKLERIDLALELYVDWNTDSLQDMGANQT